MKQMKRWIEEFTVEDLYKNRQQIGFPEFQRERDLWPEGKNALLIDSILEDIDIPKLYFSRTAKNSYEVIDGQQRLWAIWNFLDDKFTIERDGKKVRFGGLSTSDKEKIADYRLQVTVLENASENYLRELFVRLQLGLLLNPGERLNASTGHMKDLVFRELRSQKFIQSIGLADRRFGRETLCAQIAINEFSRLKTNEFSRTRYDELLRFFETFADPKGTDVELFDEGRRKLLSVLAKLGKCFEGDARKLTNRSYILSIYFLFEEVTNDAIPSRSDNRHFVQFALHLWQRLREESKLGIDRTNRDLYEFQSLLSSAPGEKYQIERRHKKLLTFYTAHAATSRLPGDRAK
jgi:Protein of unknown function DUF262